MSDETPPENVRIVQAPVQYGAQKPPQMPPGPNCPVILVFGQAGWQAQLPFDQNAALDFAAKIRRAVKEARLGFTRVDKQLVGPNGAPIPTTAAEIDDDLEDLDEPDRENESTV